MDAATRAELDVLRLRAYGPTADIDGDPAALRRLIDLEAQNLRDRAVADTEEAPPAAVSRPPTRAAPPAPPHPVPSDSPVARTRRTAAAASARLGDSVPAVGPPTLSRRAAITFASVGGALILAVAGIALLRATLPPEPVVVARAVLAPAVREARTAYSMAWDRDVVPLLQIPLDGSFGRYIDLPTAANVPEFPATGTVEWAYPLGKYFGWEVWIAGASVDETGLGREHCIVVQRNGDVRGRCVPAQLRQQSALLVSVPFASIDPDDRPIGMAADERIGFWWNHDRAVTVVLGDEDGR